jgi:hypothetical protein
MSVMGWVKEHPAEAGGIAAGVALLALLVFSSGGGGASSGAQLASQQMQDQAQLQLASIQTAPQLQALQDQFALQSSEVNAGLQQSKQQNQSNMDLGLLQFVYGQTSQQNQQEGQLTALNDYLSAAQSVAQTQADAATTINGQNTGLARDQLNAQTSLLQQYLPLQSGIALQELSNQAQGLQLSGNVSLAQIAANQAIAQGYQANQAAQISGSNTAGFMGGIGSILGGIAAFL